MPTNPTLGNENLSFATGHAVEAIARGQAIKRNAAGENHFDLCDTLGERADGIAWTAAAIGEAFTYVLLKRGSVLSYGLSGAAVAAIGANLTTNAAGKIISTVTAGHKIIGTARSITAAVDEWVAIQLEDGDRIV